MKKRFRFIIGDFDLNQPISEYGLISGRSLMFDTAIRVEIPEDMELHRYPTDSWSTTYDQRLLKDLNPKAMMYYGNRWVEVEGLLETTASTNGWYKILSSNQYRLNKQPYGWEKMDGAICTTNLIRCVTTVAREIEAKKTFNEIAHSGGKGIFMKCFLLSDKKIVLNSDLCLGRVESLSNRELVQVVKLISIEKAYTDGIYPDNVYIRIPKGTEGYLCCEEAYTGNNRRVLITHFFVGGHPYSVDGFRVDLECLDADFVKEC